MGTVLQLLRGLSFLDHSFLRPFILFLFLWNQGLPTAQTFSHEGFIYVFAGMTLETRAISLIHKLVRVTQMGGTGGFTHLTEGKQVDIFKGAGFALPSVSAFSVGDIFWLVGIHDIEEFFIY